MSAAPNSTISDLPLTPSLVIQYAAPGGFEPGAGRHVSRAHFRTDAPTLDLNGSWRFKLAPRPDRATAGYEGDSFDDQGWTRIPGHRQLQEHGRPLYTNVVYPFPLDPPWGPDENPTWEYRRVLDLPSTWPMGRPMLRFLGVDSAFPAWLHGNELGWSTGSRLATESDVGPLLRPSVDVLAVRVHQGSSASYLEDQDMWWLSGIFRDVMLIHRPSESVDDFFVQAEFDHSRRAGTLLVQTDVPVVLDLPELGLDSVPARIGRPLIVRSPSFTSTVRKPLHMLIVCGRCEAGRRTAGASRRTTAPAVSCPPHIRAHSGPCHTERAPRSVWGRDRSSCTR